MRKHLPVRLARNPIMVYVDAASSALPDRSKLRYYCEIQVPEAYLSGEFVVLETLIGFEAPPKLQSGATIYEGWRVDISSYIIGKLEAAESPDLTKDWWLDSGVITPYRTRTWIEDDGAVIENSEVLSPILYAILGGIHEEDFPTWGEQIMSGYQDDFRPWLTWQPQDLKWESWAPVFLSYLTNYDLLPEELNLICEIDFEDGSSRRDTIFSITEPLNFTAYTFNGRLDRCKMVIPEDSNDAQKEIKSWELWLQDEDGTRLTEKRRYFLEKRFEPYNRYFVFLNGLAGWDCIRLTGLGTETSKITGDMARKYLDGKYKNSDEEEFVSDKTGERYLSVSTGSGASEEWSKYLEDLLWSKRIFLFNQSKGMIAVWLFGESIVPDDNWLAERQLDFKKSKPARAFSAINPTAVAQQRETVWVPDQGYCLVNINGMRTGKFGYAILKLVHADTGERVPGEGYKTNAPGTEGYVAPIDSNDCLAATTPFKNVEINAEGSYYRSNCASGQAGTRPAIIIAAATYGSNVSQEDADSKAQTAWNALNTQAYADSNGACVIPATNGILVKFWNYVNPVAGIGPVFNFGSTPNFEDQLLNPNMNGFAATHPDAVNANVNNDNLVMELNGYLKGPVTGSVGLVFNVDDGIRVWVDDQLIIDSWKYDAGMSKNLSSSVDMTLDAFKKIKIRYYNRDGFAGLTAKWNYEGQGTVVIPDNKYFYV